MTDPVYRSTVELGSERDTLKRLRRERRGMQVTVDIKGEGSRDVEIEQPTYADLLAAVDLSTHEASVLVDGRPVPEDQPVDVEEVTVLRLIKGG